jgi:hypothetical protein
MLTLILSLASISTPSHAYPVRIAYCKFGDKYLSASIEEVTNELVYVDERTPKQGAKIGNYFMEYNYSKMVRIPGMTDLVNRFKIDMKSFSKLYEFNLTEKGTGKKKVAIFDFIDKEGSSFFTLYWSDAEGARVCDQWKQ